MLLTFIYENGGDRERVERLCEYERDMERQREAAVFLASLTVLKEELGQ